MHFPYWKIILLPALCLIVPGMPANRALAQAPPPSESSRSVPSRLSLAEAVRISLEESPQIRQSALRLMLAKSALMTAEDLTTTTVFAGVSQASIGDRSDTTVSAGSRLSWERRQGDSLSAVVVPASSSNLTSSAQIEYRRPLMRQSGRLSNPNIRIVRATYDLASQDLQMYLDRQNIVETTIANYFGAVRARDLIVVREADIQIAEETVRIARRKLEEGLIAEIELSRAEIQLASSRDALVLQRRAYRDALDRLLLGMGLKVGAQIELTDTAPATRETLDADALVEEAIANRKDLAVLEIDRERQELEASLADDDVRASLDLVGSYSKAGIGLGGSGFSSQDNWRAGLDYSIPLGDVARRERRINTRRALEQLEIDTEYRRQDIRNEVLAAIRRVDAAGQSIDIFQNNLQTAEFNLNLARRMVEEGLVTNRDILEAQVALTSTRSNLLSAQIDYYLSLLSLRRALGRDIAGEIVSQ